MSNKITAGHPEAHEKVTAKLFWKLTSETGYTDVGNVLELTDSSSRTLVTRVRAGNGARFVNDEQPDVCHEAYTVKLDERFPEQERLIKLSKTLDDFTQDSAEGATASITQAKAGKWFPIGSYNIANVVVTGSSSGLAEEGSDYIVDKADGRLQVVAGGGIIDGETLTITFDEPTIVFEREQSQEAPLFFCDVVLEEHNQYSDMFLRRRSFRAYLNVTAWPAQTGAFGVYDVKVTASGPVTTIKRPEGQTLPTHSDGGAPANSSSSSANESRSSQSESSSSS